MQKLVAFVATVAVVCVALVNGQVTELDLTDLTPPVYLIPTGQQTACASLATSFTGWWAGTTNSACTAIAAERTEWAKYIAAADLPGFTGLSSTTDRANCITAAATDQDREAMCNFLGDIVDACSCEQMKCVTNLVNAEVVPANAAACNTFAQGACNFYSVQGGGSTSTDGITHRCERALEATRPPGATFTRDPLVHLSTCPANHCTAATVSPPVDPEDSTSTEPPVTDTDATTDTGAVAPPSSTTLARTSTRPSAAAGVSSGVYLAAVALGAAAVL